MDKAKVKSKKAKVKDFFLFPFTFLLPRRGNG